MITKRQYSIDRLDLRWCRRRWLYGNFFRDVRIKIKYKRKELNDDNN
jgi:hypothetical protein